MKAVEKFEAHIADAVKKGAQIGTGSALGGAFFKPTVLTYATMDMVISKEETFKPVVALYRFKTDDEAVKRPTTPNSGSPPISTAATPAASGASPRGSNTASSARRGHNLDRDRPLRRYEG